ncbi:hypothetical protein KIL84_003822 [Mauremys mutica]|uniref:Uncharacterized protein n=1 Tax=Mauremys mutica TaxID=74926 RepID=A0A9D3WQ65_9SAUR|nr:hypothetical protein KIL84_003822 [Mauremys mutica]
MHMDKVTLFLTEVAWHIQTCRALALWLTDGNKACAAVSIRGLPKSQAIMGWIDGPLPPSPVSVTNREGCLLTSLRGQSLAFTVRAAPHTVTFMGQRRLPAPQEHIQGGGLAASLPAPSHSDWA